MSVEQLLLSLSTHSFPSSYSYGSRGFAIIVRFILVITPVLEARTGVSRHEFQNYDAIVSRILLPEVVAVVIGEDYECCLQDAYHIGWLSELYGCMEYPQDDDCPVLKKLYAENSQEMREILAQLENEAE